MVDDQELFYIDQNLTWNEASSLCRSFQSSLVTINEPLFILHVLEALAAFHGNESCVIDKIPPCFGIL